MDERLSALPALVFPGAPPPDRQLHDMEVLLEVTRLMAGAVELDELLTVILDAARKVLSAERATLFFYDAHRDELVSKIAHGADEIRFRSDAGIAGAAAQQRCTINIPDAYADPRFNREVDRQTGYRTRDILAVPLVGLDGQLVGVVQVLNKRHGSFTVYDAHLAEALAAQTAVAIQRARLMAHYVEKRQLESSLAIAREIQQSILPKEPPPVPGYDIAGWCRPADATGGDCFDFAPLRGGRLAVIVADATGHGVGPALVITETRALLRALSEQTDRVDEVLRRTNGWLHADLSDGRFVTAVYGVLDPEQHLFEYASAGHAPLFWYQGREKHAYSTGATGMPLGMLDPLEITAAPAVRFAPGDVGVFLTDGFIETQSPTGELFGQERMLRLVAEKAHLPAADLIAQMAEAVFAFAGDAAPSDDLTAVVVKRCE